MGHRPGEGQPKNWPRGRRMRGLKGFLQRQRQEQARHTWTWREPRKTLVPVILLHIPKYRRSTSMYQVKTPTRHLLRGHQETPTDATQRNATQRPTDGRDMRQGSVPSVPSVCLSPGGLERTDALARGPLILDASHRRYDSQRQGYY